MSRGQKGILRIEKGESIKRSDVVTIKDSDKSTFITLKNNKVLYTLTHMTSKK